MRLMRVCSHDCFFELEHFEDGILVKFDQMNDKLLTKIVVDDMHIVSAVVFLFFVLLRVSLAITNRVFMVVV